MAKPEPADLKQQIRSALGAVENRLGLSADLLLDDDGLAMLVDDDTEAAGNITAETEVTIELHRSDITKTLTCGELLDLLSEVAGAELVDRVECWTDKRLLLRVSDSSDNWQFLYNALENHGRALSLQSLAGDVDVDCCVTSGVTAFGVLVTASGDYEKWFPPVTDEDLFVQVLFDGPLAREVVRAAADAYIFELSSSAGITLVPSPRPEVVHDDDALGDAESHHGLDSTVTLRPLIVGKGIPELLRLYREMLQTADANLRAISLAKIFEYVSQTVIRQQVNAAVNMKLQSPRALRPDAQFVLELEGVFEEHRVFRKDREAIRITVTTCCDAVELALIAPPFLKDLSALSPDANSKQREGALTQLGYSIAATRNQAAHAKASYSPTGEECPAAQMHQFAECVTVAAQQVIRWYGEQSERLRVT